MSTLSTTNIKHPSSGSNNLVLTSGGATQIAGLTYPTADGSNGQYLRTNGSGALSWAGAGKVLQVVQGTTATEVAANSSSLVDTGLTASITPVAANSKILVIINASVRIWGGLYQGIGFALLRGSTKVWGDNGVVAEQYYFETGSNQYRFFYAAINYLDSPTYTLGNSIAYKTQARRLNTNDTRFQVNNHQSTILLLEVAA